MAVLTNSTCQTVPGSRRATTGLGHQLADYPGTAAAAYKLTAAAVSDAPTQLHHQHRRHEQNHRQQQQQQVEDAVGCGRLKASTLPRRDVVVSWRETGTENSRSEVANGNGGGSRGPRRLTTAVSDVDIAGAAASHLSPCGGATDDMGAHPNHVSGSCIISTSLLALPDTSV